MATVEPHLIHLVNPPPSQGRHLPSIQSLPLGTPGSESLSLPPLESDHGQRPDSAALLPPAAATTTQIPPLHAVGIDVSRPTPLDNAFLTDAPGQLTSSARPLQLLLGEEFSATSTLPYRHSQMFGPDSTLYDAADDMTNKKRHRAPTNKEDCVHLPQPLKKQKSTQQVMPPIIAALHEPPPNPQYPLPPISDTFGNFDNTDGLGLAAHHRDLSNSTEDLAGPGLAVSLSDGEHRNNSAGSAKTKRRAAKPRRKWTDEETDALLLGVSRHGVGKWTNILDDPDFTFNNRTAADLKDRFRTCCPAELQDASTGGSRKKNTERSHHTYSQSHHHFRNILTDPDTPNTPPPPPSAADQETFHQYSYPHSQPDSDSAPGKPQRKTRAHRKNLEDLKALGIDGPFKKARRRERRIFTPEDDKQILDGLEQYGPAWTKIQRDDRFNLKSRQPTDLRDRVRNKYPEIYSSIEKGHFNGKEAKAAGLLEPSVSTASERSGSGYPATGNELHNKSSYEDMPTRTSGRARQGLHSRPGPGLGLGAVVNSGSYGAPSDMDISRMLLNDAPHPSTGPRLPHPHATGHGSGDSSQLDPILPPPRSGRYQPAPGGSNVSQSSASHYYNPIRGYQEKNGSA
ncbi:putative myb DNA-binding domain-protein [Podospora conica]|nr:putative myb DNA-binding domain-protein [Schizothecium conicum]